MIDSKKLSVYLFCYKYFKLLQKQNRKLKVTNHVEPQCHEKSLNKKNKFVHTMLLIYKVILKPFKNVMLTRNIDTNSTCI